MSARCFVCLEEFEKKDFIKAKIAPGVTKHFAFCVNCWDKYDKDQLIGAVVKNLKDKATPKDVKRKIKKLLKKIAKR